MSGALRYYTPLPIARWNAITAATFPKVRDAVQRKGMAWFALLRDFEEKELAVRAPGPWTKLGRVRGVGLWRLDWP